jgi:hypothetical protein
LGYFIREYVYKEELMVVEAGVAVVVTAAVAIMW